MTTTVQPAASTTGKGQAWHQYASYVVYCLVALVFLSMLVLIFGLVSGEEFSPEAFVRREYRFYQIPLVGLQITPIERNVITNSLERKIGRIPPAEIVDMSDPAVHWDVVTSLKMNRGEWAGEAKILCDYLELKDAQDKLVWLDWTNAHEEMADVLWPMIASVAKARFYFLVPELLRLAESAGVSDDPAQDAENLRDLLRTQLVRSCCQLGGELTAMGQHEEAVRAYDLALGYEPQQAEAMRGRQAARASTEEAELAP